MSTSSDTVDPALIHAFYERGATVWVCGIVPPSVAALVTLTSASPAFIVGAGDTHRAIRAASHRSTWSELAIIFTEDTAAAAAESRDFAELAIQGHHVRVTVAVSPESTPPQSAASTARPR